MQRHSRFRSLVAALVLLPAIAACKDESIVGTYNATTFTYTEAGSQPVDVLAAGGSITLTIFNNLGTSGTMVLPPSVTQSSGNTTVSLLGDAAQSGDQVALSLIADTFLRDMILTFDGSSLSGTKTFSGVTVVVTLDKQ